MGILDSQTGGILKKNPTLGFVGGPTLDLPASPAAPAAAAPKPLQATADDYLKAALTNPIFTQTQGNIAADRSNFDSTRRAAIQNAVGILGFVPEGFKDSYGDIDDATRALAEKNTQAGTSTYARLRDAYQKSVRDSMRQNAARGILRSGDTGYQLGQRELESRQALSDTVGKFLEYLQTGVYGPYAQALANLNQQERDALMKVYETMQQNGLLAGPIQNPAPVYQDGPIAGPSAPVQGTTLNPFLQNGNTSGYQQPIGSKPTTLNPFLQFGNLGAPAPKKKK